MSNRPPSGSPTAIAHSGDPFFVERCTAGQVSVALRTPDNKHWTVRFLSIEEAELMAAQMLAVVKSIRQPESIRG
jgi:hypothetical protein